MLKCNNCEFQFIKIVTTKKITYIIEGIKVLAQNDFEVLKVFLEEKVKLEKLGLDNEEIRNIRIAKFEFINNFVVRGKLPEILLTRKIDNEKIKQDLIRSKDNYHPLIYSLNNRTLKN